MRKNLVRKGREFYSGYLILNRDFDRRNLDSVISMLSWCAQNMRTPRMLHFVCEIEDFDLFETNGFAQKFKEKFNSYLRQWNRERNKKFERKRKKLPDIQFFFSLESKLKDRYSLMPYHHLHLMLIVDTDYNEYGSKEISVAVTRALSSINGLESLFFNQPTTTFFKDVTESKYGFLKLRNENSSVKVGSFTELHWHNLKTELADAVCRASYLCKLDQKDLLPEKFQRGNSFGHTRPRINQSNPKVKLPSNVLVGTQLPIV